MLFTDADLPGCASPPAVPSNAHILICLPTHLPAICFQTKS